MAKSVRVRVEGWVDETGKWCINEGSSPVWPNGDTEQQFFIEADIPVPEPQTVEGRIVAPTGAVTKEGE